MFVLKYPLELTDRTQTIQMPSSADIVRVDIDGDGRICLWAVTHDKERSTDERTFVVVATGQEWRRAFVYVGTAKMEARTPVMGEVVETFFWHVLELVE